jgi:ribosomal protein L37E
MAADRYERRHRRTARNVNCIEVMANADFAAVPSLSEAMGLEEPARATPTYLCPRCGKASYEAGGRPVCCHCGKPAPAAETQQEPRR